MSVNLAGLFLRANDYFGRNGRAAYLLKMTVGSKRKLRGHRGMFKSNFPAFGIHLLTFRNDFLTFRNDFWSFRSDFLTLQNDFLMFRNDFLMFRNDFLTLQNDFCAFQNDFFSLKTDFRECRNEFLVCTYRDHVIYLINSLYNFRVSADGSMPSSSFSRCCICS